MTRAKAETGAVTLIQRFGSALNLNIHFHMLFPDGVYLPAGGGVYFHRVGPPVEDVCRQLGVDQNPLLFKRPQRSNFR